MFLTVSEFQQLNNTRLAIWEGLLVVEDAVCHNVIDPLLVALTSKRAIAAYRVAYHSVMLAAAAAFYSGVLARYGWDAFVRWAADYLARCERPAPVSLLLTGTPVPIALLPAAPVEEPRVLITPPPVEVAVQPIVASREVAVPADKLRLECDRLRSYLTDEAAFTMDERKCPNFQGFMQDLEQCAREVARLYCKRSKSQDSYKASLISRANTLIERSRSPQVATMPKPKRHLQAVK